MVFSWVKNTKRKRDKKIYGENFYKKQKPRFKNVASAK
jgi:hypothetical protein